MAAILFITEAALKQAVPVSPNIDISTPMVPSIRVAQDKYVEPMLGADLYAELEDQITGQTVTAANAALLAELKLAVCWLSLYEYLHFSWAKLREQGPVNNVSATGTVVSYGDLNRMKSQALENGTMYLNRAERWIKQHSDDYPLWRDRTGGNGSVGYNKRIYLGNPAAGRNRRNRRVREW